MAIRDNIYEDKSDNHTSVGVVLLLLGTYNYQEWWVARGDITSVVGCWSSAKGIGQDRC